MASQEEGRKPRRGIQVLAVVGAVAFLAVFVWVWWHWVPVLYEGYNGIEQRERLTAITNTRTGLLAGLVGAGAMGTFWLNSRTYPVTARTLEVTERGHLTDRYSKAIEQLGSGTLAVRLGGIYALEQLATDSPRSEDAKTIVDVLSAFVRITCTRDEFELEPSEDLLAAVSVVTRISPLPAREKIALFGKVLKGLDLQGENLAGLNLENYRIGFTNFSGASLTGAKLEGAVLVNVRLDGASLIDADLTGATFVRCELPRGDLSGAITERTKFYDTVLSSARNPRSRWTELTAAPGPSCRQGFESRDHGNSHMKRLGVRGLRATAKSSVPDNDS